MGLLWFWPHKLLFPSKHRNLVSTLFLLDREKALILSTPLQLESTVQPEKWNCRPYHMSLTGRLTALYNFNLNSLMNVSEEHVSFRLQNIKTKLFFGPRSWWVHDKQHIYKLHICGSLSFNSWDYNIISKQFVLWRF